MTKPPLAYRQGGKCLKLSRPGLQHQIERRFGGAGKPLEAALRHHFSETLLAGPRADARTDFPGTRCGCAYECRRRVEDASDGIEVGFESVTGEGLDDQPCVIGLLRTWAAAPAGSPMS